MTDTLLVREDGIVAYPVIDEIPVLLGPEALFVGEEETSFNLAEPKYAEAYVEMDVYNATAAESESKLGKRRRMDDLTDRDGRDR